MIVPTHLKNVIVKIGTFPQVGMNIKNRLKHQHTIYTMLILVYIRDLSDPRYGGSTRMRRLQMFFDLEIKSSESFTNRGDFQNHCNNRATKTLSLSINTGLIGILIVVNYNLYISGLYNPLQYLP